MPRFNPFHSSNKNWVAQAEHKLKVAWHSNDMTSVVQTLNQLMGSIPAPMWEGIPDAAFCTFISWAFQSSQVCDQVRAVMEHKGAAELEVNIDAQPCLIVPQCLHRNYGTATTECAQSLLQLAAEAQLQIKESTIGQPRLALILVLERVLGSEAGFVAAKNSKNGLKSTFCPQDTPVEREALPQTLSRTKN